MAKWIKGTKTLDLNVKTNMDAWRKRTEVINLTLIQFYLD